jgi:hypothetical protein
VGLTLVRYKAVIRIFMGSAGALLRANFYAMVLGCVDVSAKSP